MASNIHIPRIEIDGVGSAFVKLLKEIERTGLAVNDTTGFAVGAGLRGATSSSKVVGKFK
ncbi:MAG: hypothetical protein VYE18_07770 [Pseudomonadota bacterium]|nr:hypothetical protein [Pseudomonadota bacterium]